jgi:DNA/RNA endonuclease YhcR with UshA esterase domain
MPPYHPFAFALPLVAVGLLVAPAFAAAPSGRSATLERSATAAIAPEEALAHVGKQVVVEFVVKGGRRLDDKEICFLNSKQDHREQGTFTAVIFRAGLARFAADGVANPADEFLAKTIRVSGTVEDRSGQAQIVIESPTQIEVVEAADPVSPDARDR